MQEKLGPTRISHVGIQTYNLPRIRDWYCALLNGEVVHERPPNFCLVSFDDEHHRFAIGGLQGERQARNPRAEGFSHVAFTVSSIFAILEIYERGRDLGITPTFTLHHGPTVSMYYTDPDGNRVELLVERFKTMAEAKAFIHGPVFAHTLGTGIAYDAEAMLARMKAGASEAELMYYDEEAAMKVDALAEIEKSRFAIDKKHLPEKV